jgi:hypothetical protein
MPSRRLKRLDGLVAFFCIFHGNPCVFPAIVLFSSCSRAQSIFISHSNNNDPTTRRHSSGTDQSHAGVCRMGCSGREGGQPICKTGCGSKCPCQKPLRNTKAHLNFGVLSSDNLCASPSLLPVCNDTVACSALSRVLWAHPSALVRLPPLVAVRSRHIRR